MPNTSQMTVKTPSTFESDYITADELLIRFKHSVKKRTIANWRSNGDGPKYMKIGGRVLYSLAAVIAWEKTREMGS